MRQKTRRKSKDILWSRLTMPYGKEINLDLPSLDPAGSAGVPGKVHNHLAEVFGAAALGTLINIGVAAIRRLSRFK
jgi:type IV secretory pathway VirB10-like protein